MLRITGGEMLQDGVLERGELGVEEGRIVAGGSGGTVLDATGWLVLPGIVDIHGDAFERQLQPRPGVDFSADLAMAETERQLLANGITTAFHGITLSWEPGLRSAATWRRLLDALQAGHWTCDMRVHMRWEAFNLDALDLAVADIEAGRVGLLAFNDHTPSILRKLANPVSAAAYGARAGMEVAAFQAVAEQAAARANEVPAGLERLASAARAAGLPMASHDDATVETRDAFRGLGAGICEFPVGADVGLAARGAGDAVVMGSPNVVRGGSHIGWASAADLAEAGTCTVLASDYYYPCLLQAPFALAARGRLSLAAAWALVSSHPARAARLDDRGSLAPGERADLVVVDPDPAGPRVVATIAAGRIGHLDARAARRLALAA